MTTTLSKMFLSKRVSKLKIEEINNFHSKVAKEFYSLSCLPLCISAKIVLSIYGYETKIQSGIKIKKKKIKGHAWLVSNDQVSLDQNNKIHEYKKSLLIN